MEQEELQQYLDKRPAKRPRKDAPTAATSTATAKRTAPNNATIIDVDADDDEFDCGIDYDAMDESTYF